jgi:hypothetical protein
MRPYENPIPHVVTAIPAQPTPETIMLDSDFGAGELEDLIVRPTQKPWLQWMTGKLPTTTFEATVGWHIQAEVDPDLDEVLASMHTKRYIVQHPPSSNGEAKQVPYWALNAGGTPCSLFVIAYGVPSTREMGNDHQKRFGVAYAWEVVKDKQGQVVTKKTSHEPKRQCRVQFRAFVHELVAQGYQEWFQVNISGYLTDDILAALHSQYRVLDAFDGRMRAQGSNLEAPFWGFSIPCVPGTARFVKPKDGGDGTNIIPMVTHIPERVEDISISYLNAHRIPKDLQKRVREQLLDEAFTWSSMRTLEMYGENPLSLLVHQEGPAPITEEIVAPSLVKTTLPSALPAIPADAITATQVQWITSMCGNNPQVIRAWCEKFQIPDLAYLRSNQFLDLFNLMSQDHQ